jgi:hypothetical protein
MGVDLNIIIPMRKAMVILERGNCKIFMSLKYRINLKNARKLFYYSVDLSESPFVVRFVHG